MNKEGGQVVRVGQIVHMTKSEGRGPAVVTGFSPYNQNQFFVTRIEGTILNRRVGAGGTADLTTVERFSWRTWSDRKLRNAMRRGNEHYNHESPEDALQHANEEIAEIQKNRREMGRTRRFY